MNYKSKYLEQIKSPKWQKRRLEILNRDNFTCQICGCTENTLHVHHTIYIPGRKIWEYEDDQLITLCEGCHAEEHGDLAEMVNNLITDLKFQGLTNFEIQAYLGRYTACGIMPDFHEIKEWNSVNPSKSEQLLRLAQRRKDIVYQRYNLNESE